ncbi:MAG TPA: gamma-glutamyltransferase [Thermomicrobiales bacterium]|nr:gamma-glutamyltransferase [Thermomicrobiales bacterium]
MHRYRPDSSLLALRQASTRRQLLGGAATAMAGGLALHAPGITAAQQPSPGSHVQAVVSSHREATAAGMAILEQGGTAADAAIAMAAVLSVVEPWFSSVLGGGTWALYYDAATHSVTSMDGVGPVGGLATLEGYGERADTPGIHQAIVPGAWDGWMLWLQEYGRLELGIVLDPAIRLAREGHEASAEMVTWLGRREEEVLDAPDTAAIYAPDGELIGEGDLVQNPNFADSLEALARAFAQAAGEGREAAVQAARDYFYRGPLAEAIVAFSEENDGYFTLEDFTTFESALLPPIAIDYGGGITVVENPPNSQGITMLLALNILKGMNISQYPHHSADAIHLQVEALKLAFADRYEYIGDPDRIDMPIDALLSDAHAEEQRQRIDMDRAMEWPIDGRLARVPHHTTTFHVTDREGNGAAVTTSLGAQFLVVGDTGIHINERMEFLSLEEGNANELMPGFKVRHTSCPYMAFRGNRLWILGGNTGVDTQPQGQTQQFISVAEYGMGAQEAVNQPRFVTTAFPETRYPSPIENTLQMQAGFRGSVVAELRERGHEVDLGEGTFGSANMIVITPDGTDAETGAEPDMTLSAGEVVPAGS